MAQILIIEDDPSIMQLILLWLEQQGRRDILSAFSGEVGVELAEQLGEIGMIVVDIYLPGISGFEVARKIRQKPNLKKA